MILKSGCFEFGEFSLDLYQRQLRKRDVPVALNSRYLDALALLVAEQGSLVTKDHFMEQVWAGVPVSDEALTQCIRTLRQRLDDDARRPCFIETVPKHGYRFIAPVQKFDSQPCPLPHSTNDAEPGAPVVSGPSRLRRFASLTLGGAIGGVLAGLIGGLLFGSLGAFQPAQAGATGTFSVLIVLASLTVLTAAVGGAGVALGIAAIDARGRPSLLRYVVGGCVGGVAVGALTKLLILDAFQVVAGRSPGDVTGAFEGALLGAAIGLAAGYALLGPARRSLPGSVGLGAACGGLAGFLVAGLDGRLMAGSLDLLARSFTDSRIRFDGAGLLFGEDGFGRVSQIAIATAEGALLGACVVGVMILAERRSCRAITGT